MNLISRAMAALAAIAGHRSRSLAHVHDFGPMQKTPMGFGQKCSICKGWRWRDSTEEALRLLHESD